MLKTDHEEEAEKGLLSSNKNKLEEPEQNASKYNDQWASYLYLACLVIFIITASYAISLIKPVPSSGASTPNPAQDNFPYGSVFLSIFLGATFFTLLFCYAVYRYTEQAIAGVFWFGIVITGLMGASFLIAGNIFLGIFLLFCTSMVALSYRMWSLRIIMATLVLSTVVSILKKYPSMVFVNIYGLIASTAFFGFWSYSFYGVSFGFVDANNDISSAGSVALLYLVFFWFWTFEVINNICHVVLSGAYASFFFSIEGLLQPNIISKSTKRALTYSFGSICYGSLLLALMQTLRFLIHLSKSQTQRNSGARFILACLDCIASCFRDLIQYFNRYAFVEVAVYGKDYFEAAKAVSVLFQQKGIDAIINDDLISNVLMIGIFVGGIGTAGVGYAASIIYYQNASSELSLLMSVMGFIIGSLFLSIVSYTIYSGTATIFVCLAEDPEALSRSQPDLYQRYQQMYPQVLF